MPRLRFCALCRKESGDVTQVISLPHIHCAGCIQSVENTLRALPGVRSARVNLTLKRAYVCTRPVVIAEDLVETISKAASA